MDKPAILQALRALTGQVEIILEPLLGKEYSAYAPINKYVLDVTHSKPESAAEDLFRSLVSDLIGRSVHPQVRTPDGFVDFAVAEDAGEPVMVELKPLFDLYSAERLRSLKLKPGAHLDQIKKYLRKHEYVVLTDLRDAYLYNARDTFVDEQPFLHLTFADLLERALPSRSLLDALRRAEDQVEKPELDRVFFEDLKDWFRRFQSVRFVEPGRAAELVILLINKIVFAKTLEDFGLVPFRFLQNEYENQKERWIAKGAPSTIRSFLANFEEFFDEHYDTELFETKLWPLLDKDPNNLATFARALDDVLGIDAWSKVFRRGIVHYNYRRINEDIFGKSYEMFLAANRKDEGIFYTPAPITTPMADSLVAALVRPLVDELTGILSASKPDYAAAEPLMQRLGQLRIVDMAGGSGGFQIKVLRALWEQYQRIAGACVPQKMFNGELTEATPDDLQLAQFRHRHLLRSDQRRDLVAAILLRHIWCVDKDAGALEVAKTNIWKEAVKLSPSDYLFSRLDAANAKILPNLELNFLCADSLVDLDTAQQVNWLAAHRQADVARLHALRDQYVANPSDHAPLEAALALRAQLRAAMQDAFKEAALPAPPLLAALSFFPCYFAPDGQPMPPDQRGFDGNIGNPPWEAVKPIRKEVAGVDKYKMAAVDFDPWFAKKLKDDPEFAARWQKHQTWHEAYKNYLARRFQHQGTGDWNYYKLFLENDLDLLKCGGQLALLIPSGIQTDEGCTELRRLLVTQHTLNEISSFENRGYRAKVNGEEKTVKIFPDVDNRFKFGMLRVVKGLKPAESHSFGARFYLHDPAELELPPIKYSVGLMKRFSPQNLSLMEFRNERDYELCAKIRGEHRLLGELGYLFRRELHPADDVVFLHKRGPERLKAGQLPVSEGKMIFQYDSDFAPGTYYSIEKDVRAELLRKELHRLAQFARKSGLRKLNGRSLPKNKDELTALLADLFDEAEFKLDFERDRLGYRRIGSSTNERTIIATLLRQKVVLLDTLSYLVPHRYEVNPKGKLLQTAIERDEVCALLSLLNSFALNFYIRNKMSATVNMFYAYELPIPNLADKLRVMLVAGAEKLLADPHDVKERAKLEVLIARDAYGLEAADWQHLTGTFTYGSGDTKAELDAIIARATAEW